MLIFHAFLLSRFAFIVIIAYSLSYYMEPKNTQKKLYSYLTFIIITFISQIFILFLTEYLPHNRIIIPVILPFHLFSYFSALHLSFKGTISNKVFVTFLIMILGSLTEIIIRAILFLFFGLNDIDGAGSLFDTVSPIYLREGVILIAVNFLAFLVLFRFLGRKRITPGKQNTFRLLIFSSLQLSFAVFLFYLSNEDMYTYFFIATVYIVIPILNIALFIYILFSNNRNYETKLKEELARHLVASQEQYISEIIEQSSQLTRLKHDFKTHVRVLSDMAETEKYDELKNYLSEFSDEYVLEPLIFCSRSTLNSVLSSKYKLAKAEGVELKVFFNCNGAEHINDIDLCTVVSNLLQNAIEACERLGRESENRFITLHTSSKKGCFIITQTNSSLQPNEDFITMKPDTKNHGIGLKTIENITAKYNGKARFEFKDGSFTSTLIFYD